MMPVQISLTGGSVILARYREIRAVDNMMEHGATGTNPEFNVIVEYLPKTFGMEWSVPDTGLETQITLAACFEGLVAFSYSQSPYHRQR
jgi:hypothetical protein